MSTSTSLSSSSVVKSSTSSTSLHAAPTKQASKSKDEKSYFDEERHRGAKLPQPLKPAKVGKWRMKERMKTVSVSLVLCLNIGVDPPDVIKTSPCARMECWTDPLALSPQKALDTIGRALQSQYERWQPRARYKLSLDPTVEEVKKMCIQLRRNAKEERVVFHYNGHGVPKPTNNGEIWVFNRNYTQYIPLSIYELQTWMGAPSIYVFDCSNAGLIVHWFKEFARQRERKQRAAMAKDAAINAANGNNNQSSSSSKKRHITMSDCILLAACGSDESLPTDPELPVDIFTACLTTPIKVALRYGARSILSGVPTSILDCIPGKLNDRKTPLGELNWIFTAVTDTIAWNVLPRPLFQKLFRQDLLVASLFRNFLLAERVMRSGNCTPISVPPLPATYNHPMWQAWDLAADLCLSQLPQLLRDPSYQYKRSPFFAEQLTSFEVWLDHGPDSSCPAQLPIVLQVLLSQAHRLRALVLLGRFLDAGPWAVNLSLSVGIFPYVLRLLQSPVLELRRVLVFIWTKLLALDRSCQVDLVKDNGHNYFINVLSSPEVPPDQRTQAAFVLTCIMDKCRPGQQACLASNLLAVALSQINSTNASLRRWCIFCLGKLWESHREAKELAVQEDAHERVCGLLTDAVPEVRAAAVWALTAFLGGAHDVQRVHIELNIGLTLPVVMNDASPLVRRELVSALARLIDCYRAPFEAAATQIRRERAAQREAHLLQQQDVPSSPSSHMSGGSLRRFMSPATKRRAPRTPESVSPAVRANDDTPVTTRPRSDLSRSLGTVPRMRTQSYSNDNNNGSVDDDNESSQDGTQDNSDDIDNVNGIYICLWKMTLQLAQDPYPEIAQLASLLYERVVGQSPQISSIAARHHPGELVTPTKRTNSTQTTSNSGSMRFGLSGFLRRTSTPHDSNDNRESLLTSAPPSPLRNKSMEVGGDRTPLRKSNRGKRSSQGASTDDPETDEDSESDVRAKLRSTLYEWSCDFFSRPLHPDNCEVDKSSHTFMAAQWRRDRVNALNEMAALRAHRNAPRTFNEQIAILKSQQGAVARLMFHPVDDFLISADDRDGVHVWSWREGKRVVSFANTGTFHARVTSMQWLNSHNEPLLLTGAQDGVVRVWHDVTTGPPRLVTCFRALGERTRRSTRLVVSWQQHHGLLMCSGDVQFVRAWDVVTELVTQDIPTQSNAAVTCLASDLRGGRLVGAGCADGAVRLFDWRVPPLYSNILNLEEHHGFVVGCSMVRNDDKIISGSVSGEVKLWDPRVNKSLATFTTAQNDVVNAMAVHEWSPVVACGSQNQRIKLMSFQGNEISTIRYHDGFLGQRIGPVSALAFHPRSAIMAAGATDSIISIYSGISKN